MLKWKLKLTTAAMLVVFTAGVSFFAGAYQGRHYADRDTIKALKTAMVRNESLERLLAQEEQQTQAQIETLRVDAESARNHAGRLFNELSRCESNSTTISGGSTTDDSTGVRTFVLGEVERRLTTLAQYADESRIAGTACENQYNTVKDLP